VFVFGVFGFGVKDKFLIFLRLLFYDPLSEKENFLLLSCVFDYFTLFIL